MTSRQQRVITIGSYALIVAIGILLLLSILELRRRLDVPPVPPVPIVAIAGAAENPKLCPGELLRWPLTITYNRAPLLMDVYRHLRNLDTGGLLLNNQTHVVIPQEETGTFARDAVWPVPVLSPGRYRLITSTMDASGSELLQYYIEFKIEDDCEANR